MEADEFNMAATEDGKPAFAMVVYGDEGDDDLVVHFPPSREQLREIGLYCLKLSADA